MKSRRANRSVKWEIGALLLLCGVGIMGCGDVGSAADTEFAHLYAEVLIAEMKFGSDSVELSKALDSLLVGSDFTTVQEIRDHLEELTNGNEERLERIMDSTQKRLEQIRDGK